MIDIETRQPALRAEVITVLAEQQVTAMHSDRASLVDRARPGIAEEVGQTLREPALQFHAQRVVVCFAAAIDFLDQAKLRIGRSRGKRASRSWYRNIEVPE